MDESFLAILRCPITRQPLRLADDETLARVNDCIARNELISRGDEPIEQQLTKALISEDAAYLYPVTDDIPALTPDRAIELDQIEKTNE